MGACLQRELKIIERQREEPNARILKDNALEQFAASRTNEMAKKIAGRGSAETTTAHERAQPHTFSTFARVLL